MCATGSSEAIQLPPPFQVSDLELEWVLKFKQRTPSSFSATLKSDRRHGKLDELHEMTIHAFL